MQNLQTNGVVSPKKQRQHLSPETWDMVYRTMDFRLLIPNIKRVSKQKLWRLTLMCMGALGFTLRTNGVDRFDLCLDDPDTLNEFRNYISENLDTLGIKSETIN